MMGRPGEQPQSQTRRQSNRPVWLGLASAILLIVALTALFALQPWDRSKDSQVSAANSEDGSEATPERAKLPKNLCKFVADDALDLLVPPPHDVTPRTLPSTVGEEVACDVDSDSGGLPFLSFEVERAGSGYDHGEVVESFSDSCERLGTLADGPVDPLSGTSSDGICGNIEHVPESDIIGITVHTVKSTDIISVSYSVTARTDQEVEQARQGALTLVNGLVQKLHD